MPNPPEELAWGSQSTSRQVSPSRANAAERLIAVVVFPTPPFWLTTAITLPICNGRVSSEGVESKKGAMCRSGTQLWRTPKRGRRRELQLSHLEGDRGDSPGTRQ